MNQDDADVSSQSLLAADNTPNTHQFSHHIPSVETANSYVNPTTPLAFQRGRDLSEKEGKDEPRDGEDEQLNFPQAEPFSFTNRPVGTAPVPVRPRTPDNDCFNADCSPPLSCLSLRVIRAVDNPSPPPALQSPPPLDSTPDNLFSRYTPAMPYSPSPLCTSATPHDEIPLSRDTSPTLFQLELSMPLLGDMMDDSNPLLEEPVANTNSPIRRSERARRRTLI